MKNFAGEKSARVIAAFALLVSLMMPCATAFAHGGEDHGEKQTPVVSMGSGMATHIARAGEMEVVIKHPPLEPDKEVSARLFVTRFATNEPIGGAKIVVALSSNESAAPIEATAIAAAAGATPGIYEVKLPPLPKGQYKFTARVDHNGRTDTAEYGTLQIAPPPVAANGSVSTWARTALFILAALVGLCVAGALVYRFTQGAQRGRDKGETATA